jgi:hypothetical protein
MSSYADKVNRKFDDAKSEYAFCRSGISDYNDHLFKIRSWSIALTGLIIATAIGVDPSKSSSDPSSLIVNVTFGQILSAHLLMTTCFWSFDTINKIKQEVYIYCARDIERFLREEPLVDYCGPSISMRFARKDKRLTVSLVTKLFHNSIAPFYIMQISAVFMISTFLKFDIETAKMTVFNITPLKVFYPFLILALCFLYYLHHTWSSKRENMNLEAILRINQAIRDQSNGVYGGDKIVIGPFSPEYHSSDGKNLVFVDRIYIWRNRNYVKMRSKILNNMGYNSLSLNWINPPDYISSTKLEIDLELKNIEKIKTHLNS